MLERVSARAVTVERVRAYKGANPSTGLGPKSLREAAFG